MSNVLKVSLQTTIYSLADRGWSQRRIASELGINRETVGRYLRLAKPAISTTGTLRRARLQNQPFRSPGNTQGRKSQNQPFRLPALGLGAEITANRWPSDCRQGRDRLKRPAYLPRSGRTKRLQRFLPIGTTFCRKPQRVWRMEARPGEEVQVDFGLGAPIFL